jgi:uncharacterized protein
MSAYEKLEALKGLISSSNGITMAFSGGVGSTLLKAVAYEVLGDRRLAVIATSSTYPNREYAPTIEWVKTQGEKEVRHMKREEKSHAGTP